MYWPKLRDRVVLDAAILDALAKLDPKFGYAEEFDAASGQYRGLLWQKAPVGPMPQTALLVRPEVVVAQLRRDQPAAGPQPSPIPGQPDGGATPPNGPAPIPNPQPRRFFGSVEVDTVRPVKAFEAIVNAVVAELQRTKGAKIKLTLEIEAQAEAGFDDADIGVVRDNANQLKFNPGSTGFE